MVFTLDSQYSGADVSTVSGKAASIVELLRQAEQVLEDMSETTQSDTTKENTDTLEEHIDQISGTIDDLNKIVYHDALQTPNVSHALPKVEGAAQRLVKLLDKRPNLRLSQLKTAMNELGFATTNLNAQIPGRVTVSARNTATASLQLNAPVLGRDTGGRINSTSEDNNASNGSVQINAELRATPEVIKDIFSSYASK